MANNLKLAMNYFESVMKRPMDSLQPVPVSGRDVIEILWPLNDVFRPYLTRIRSIRYSSSYEASADRAIEAFAKCPKPETWGNLKPQTWRILLERHQQLLMVGMANEAAGNQRLTLLPLDLPEYARLPGIMLLLLHSMRLPWPVEDRSGLEMPEGAEYPSMMLH